ncbi:methyltransferase family protein [Roseibium hamelinense]|uniref:Methyltransferase family protein n=1 Tax=Roseibium hamelinense TaxID=150831 RepID=A0A562SEX4_9HYPH|nr:methyltransferase domain-containing protein [Roseibium hamelinense]MTI42859.1 methyltransferase domain-containing protein [Roseibium hamelinense]TWI79891.1 methyltransferase family protein [Roseibium hamelinense]
MQQVEIFDRNAVKKRRTRAVRQFRPGADFIAAIAAADIAERLAPINRSFDVAIDLGGHNDAVCDVLKSSGKTKHVFSGDLFVANTHRRATDFVFDDALPPLADGCCNLILSALTLHAVNDLPGSLVQLRRALRPDGLLLATLVGGDTLHELRDVLMRAELEMMGGAAIRVAPFTDTRDAGALLQRAGFALPVADKDSIIVRYDNMFGLLNDLRAMGSTAALADQGSPLSRQTLFKAAEIYASDYADEDGRIRATFDLITLSGWAAHESQQKPLKPGSAQKRLSDVL